MLNAHSLSQGIRTGKLARDQRGAILVPALVMGALMTGAMFYVAAAGDAIIFKTELQNAADVTSFKSAVWHARGMNGITSLNQFMVTVLAVFSVIRVARLVVLIIPVVGGAAQAPLQTAEMSVKVPINLSLRALEAAESGVSAAIPYVALVDAKSTPTAAETIWPLSLSLLPPISDRVLAPETRRPQMGPAALPVEAGDFGTLCGRSVMAIPNLLVSLLLRWAPGWVPDSMLRGWLEPVTDVVLDDVGVRVFGLGDGVFCQPLEGSVTRLLSFLGQEACDQMEQQSSSDEQAHEEAEREANQQNGGTASGGSQSSGSQGSGSQSAGSQGSGSRNGRNGRGNGSNPASCGGAVESAADAARSAAGFTARPAFVWRPAKNGNPATHVWTWAMGQPRLFSRTQRGVGTANGGVAPTVRPAESAVAMSEYYFDCDKVWSPDCKEDAPWAPNWTARVRRFRSPLDELRTIGLSTPLGILESLQAPVNELVTDLVGEALHEATGLPGDNPVTRFIGEQVGRIPLIREMSETIASATASFESATGLDRLLEPRRYVDERRVH